MSFSHSYFRIYLKQIQNYFPISMKFLEIVLKFTRWFELEVSTASVTDEEASIVTNIPPQTTPFTRVPSNK